MKSDWVVLGIAGALGFLAIADRPNSSSQATALPATSQPATLVPVAPPASQSAFLIAQTPAPLMFKGYECTVDCSGHEAGYRWAEDKGIDDPDDCGGNSQSFIEGCQAYAEEQQGLVRSNDDDSDEENDNEEN